jgi:uncharacterized membrane protein YciS (DUF1049 family)
LTYLFQNAIIIMSISEYKRKLKDNELSKKLEKAEQELKELTKVMEEQAKM